MATANYRCGACGKEVELTLPKPDVVELYCCVRVRDVSGECSDPDLVEHRRVWSAPHIGRVVGAGGSPAR